MLAPVVFLWIIYDFSLYKITLFVNRKFSFYPLWMPVISFSCLVALARTPNTVLNESGKSGHLCLVPDFRGKAFSFSSFSKMLGVGFS